jgi:voltage-gated potassium channel
MPLFLLALAHRLSNVRVRALLAFAATMLLLGAVLFTITEGVSFGIGLYWAITTATTVGYGDVNPHDTAGRIVANLVMLTTIPTIGAVFALTAGASVLARIRRLLGMDMKLPNAPYAIVFGTHQVIPRVLDELSRAGDPVVLVSPDRPPGTPDSVHFLAGDPTDEAMVHRCELHRASRALIACEADADTLVIAVAIHATAPDLEVFALTQSKAVARALGELGVTHTLASDELVGHTVAKSLETPQAGSLLLQLIDNSTYRLVEAPVDPAFVSQPLSKARATADSLVLGIARGSDVDLGIADDPVLASGDRLIVLEARKAA